MANKVILTPEQKTKIVNYCLSLSTLGRADKASVESSISEYWLRHFGTYSCKKDKDFPFKGSADIQTGVIQYIDSSIEARFQAALSSLKLVKIDAQSQAGMIAAQHATNFLNTYWKNKSDVVQVIVNFFQFIVVEGTGAIHIRPVKAMVKVKRYALVTKLQQVKDGVLELLGYKKDDKNKLETELIEQDNFIGCEWENVPILNLNFDSNVSTLKKSGWLEHIFYLSPFEIKQRVKKDNDNIDTGWDEEAVKKLLAGIEKNNTPVAAQIDSPTTESDQSKRDYQGYATGNTDKKSFSAYYVKFDINEDGNYKDFYVIIGKEKNLLMYYKTNEFFDNRKPFVASPCYRIAGKIEGQGLPQRMAKLNDILDTNENQKIDNRTLCNSFNFLYTPGSGFDPDKISFIPGKGIPLKSVEKTAFQQLDFRSSPMNFVEDNNFIMGLVERKALVSDYSLGREADNPKATAAGTAMLLKEFSVNLNPLIRNLQIALEEAFRQTLWCLYETMPEDGIKYTIADQTLTFKREYLEFMDEFEISILEGAVETMVEQEKQTALNLYTLFGQDQSGEINTFELKKNVIDKFDPILAKTLLRTPQEVQLVQALKQKAVVMAQQEEMLNQKIAEMDQMRQGMVIEEGKKAEDEFIKTLQARGITDTAKIAQMAEEFRKQFIAGKMSQGQPTPPQDAPAGGMSEQPAGNGEQPQ